MYGGSFSRNDLGVNIILVLAKVRGFCSREESLKLNGVSAIARYESSFSPGGAAFVFHN
jgi:hypothetical protein